MSNICKTVSKAITTTNDATDWLDIDVNEPCSIVIPAGLTGVVRIQRSFDGGTTTFNLTDDAGVSDFVAGAQLDYVATSSQKIRIIATTVTAGSATAFIKRG